jgi:hypothetical protein
VDADAVLTTDSDADQSDTHAADEAPPSAPVNRMDTLVLAARHTEAMEFHAKLADYRSKSSTPVASDHHNKSLTEAEVLVSYNLYEVPSDDQKGKLKKRKLVPETRLQLKSLGNFLWDTEHSDIIGAIDANMPRSSGDSKFETVPEEFIKAIPALGVLFSVVCVSRFFLIQLTAGIIVIIICLSTITLYVSVVLMIVTDLLNLICSESSKPAC